MMVADGCDGDLKRVTEHETPQRSKRLVSDDEHQTLPDFPGKALPKMCLLDRLCAKIISAIASFSAVGVVEFATRALHGILLP